MPFLIHFFLSIISPSLNMLIWLYQVTHSFGLAIISLAALLEVCLFWPINYTVASARKRILTAESVGLTYRMSPFAIVMPVFNILAWYLLVTIYLSLTMLGNCSLSTLNEILYPFMTKLSALPHYDFSLLGQTISLVQRGFFLGLELFIFPISSFIAFVNVHRARRKGEPAQFLRTFLSLCLFYTLQLLILSWILTVGAGLYWITSMTLFAGFRFFLNRRNLDVVEVKSA